MSDEHLVPIEEVEDDLYNLAVEVQQVVAENDTTAQTDALLDSLDD